MNDALPALAELLPQRGAMRLLDRVLDHGDDGTRCAVLPGASALFRQPDGRVPVWVALEYMAQCAAVDGALRMRGLDAVDGALHIRERDAAQPAAGLLVGSRQLVFRRAWLDPTRALEVTARHAAGRGRRLAFDCALLDPGGGAPWAEGRLNVLLAERPGVAEPAR